MTEKFQHFFYIYSGSTVIKPKKKTSLLAAAAFLRDYAEKTRCTFEIALFVLYEKVYIYIFIT